MGKTLLVIILILIIVLSGCKSTPKQDTTTTSSLIDSSAIRRKSSDGGGGTSTSISSTSTIPSGFVTGFQDGFESYSTPEDLFPDDKSKYTYQALTGSNIIEISTEQANSGVKSIKFIGKTSTSSETSKNSIAKENLYFKDGETILATGYYYFPSVASLKDVFIMDIEGEPTSYGAPGIRLTFIEGDYLTVERGKFGEKSIYQLESKKISFPRNKWTQIEWEIKLSRTTNGYVKVRQDGVEIISADNIKTMPTDVPGIIVGTLGIYNSFEIGLTAFPRTINIDLYVDDVSIKKV